MSRDPHEDTDCHRGFPLEVDLCSASARELSNYEMETGKYLYGEFWTYEVGFNGVSVYDVD